jgi:hypothetical protein
MVPIFVVVLGGTALSLRAHFAAEEAETQRLLSSVLSTDAMVQWVVDYCLDGGADSSACAPR